MEDMKVLRAHLDSRRAAVARLPDATPTAQSLQLELLYQLAESASRIADALENVAFNIAVLDHHLTNPGEDEEGL